MNRLLNRGLASLGLGKDRVQPPPKLIAAADGLLISEHRAEAWYLIPTKNSDLADPGVRDSELDDIVRFAMKFLGERDCHLKLMWGRVSGLDYAKEMAPAFVNGDGDAWAELRGARIDADDLPQRYVMLGVKIADRKPRSTSALPGVVAEALATNTRQVSNAELKHLSDAAIKMGQALAKSPWQARLASVEEITWMISREMHRDAVAIPKAGTVAGAPLARVTAGKTLPYSDHLQTFDTADNVVAYTCVLTMDEFDEILEVPGPGEWLKTLSYVTYIDAQGVEHPVNVDASIRFTVLKPQTAGKLVSETKQSAKEQARSAAQGTAGVPSEEVSETEDVMSQIQRDIRRDGITLVEDHPRLIVSATSRAELEVHVDAVIQHFAERGITINIGANEQRDLWLETVAGDRLRVTDLGHVREAGAFFGSSFWCGSRVGDGRGPAIGVLTGSTPGIVRNDVAAGSARGDATTTVMIGRSGRGKSTAIMLSGLDSSMMGAWTVVFDLKGDLAGVVDAATDYGIPSRVTKISPKYSGAADLFRFLPLEEVVLQIPAQLSLIAPRELRAGAESLLVAAVRAESTGNPNPSSWGVIQRLKNSDDPESARLGRVLHDLTQDGLGSIIAGPVSDADPLTTDPGLWLVQMPGLGLPHADSDPEQWNTTERISMAVLRGVLTWMVSTSGSQVFRRRPKVICIPEVHLLDKTADGAAFLNNLARMGRAFDTSLVLDTQDAVTITRNPGLVEQVTTVFAFSLRSPEQVAGALELLGLPNNAGTRALVRDINSNPDRSIRHGHCLMRDRHDEVATIQWQYPNTEVAAQLNTNPDGGQGEYDDDPVYAGEEVTV